MAGDEVSGAAQGTATVDRPAVDDDDGTAAAGQLQGRGETDDSRADDDDLVSGVR